MIGYALEKRQTVCRFGFEYKGRVSTQIECANVCSAYESFTFYNAVNCPSGGCPCYCIKEKCVMAVHSKFDYYKIKKGESLTLFVMVF